MEQKTLDKINKLTRREFTEGEVYIFSVILCDNDIDRDGERFSDDALEQLQPLFIGKTGIFDHDPSSSNQNARIFDTELVTDTSRRTKYGEVYKYLKASAYMVRTDENKNLIAEIDGGIKKEVSIACSAASKKCSICGCDRSEGNCSHIKGKSYGNKLCHTILGDITDAYEWSFVAVPAQVNAGVTKKYKGGNVMEEFIPITTKAAFDTAVQPLIDAAVSAKAAEFEGWLSPEAHQQALDALKNEHKSVMLKSYREKAALMTGLAPELADRLNGDTEEDIKNDAEQLAAITKSGYRTPSFNSSEGNELSDVEKAFYSKNKNLIPNNRKEK